MALKSCQLAHISWHRSIPIRAFPECVKVGEGRLELLGARAMYGNLVEAGLLEGGTNVIGSLGHSNSAFDCMA